MHEQEDLASIMEEPPGGENHGTVTSSYVDEDGGVRVTKTPLGPSLARLERGGYGVVTEKSHDGGLVAHRSVLHPDEHVDTEALQGLVERALGFTYEDISSVYRQGPLSPDQRQLRESIDARLLALSRSGGNMLALAKVLGWGVEASDDGGGPSSRTMERALARARDAE